MKKQFHSSKPSGFTLIEFLVASALAMIVIVAAGSTYFMTRRLNDTTQARLNIQQDLRIAASMFTRDARNAGSFGCFSSTSGHVIYSNASGSTNKTFPSVPNGDTRQLSVTGKGDDGFGVRVLAQNRVSSFPNFPSSITPQSDMIIFIYGKGALGVTDTSLDGSNSVYRLSNLDVHNYADEADISTTVTARGDLVVSSCSAAYAAKVTGGATGSNANIRFADTAANRLGEAARAEINVSKLYAAAYVLGENNGKRSLLRFDLDAAGNWQGPQLLAENISSMEHQFGYVSNCQNDEPTTLNRERFTFTTDLSKEDLPAVVRMHLRYDTSTSANGSNLADYMINAAVRAGNVCATTSPQ